MRKFKQFLIVLFLFTIFCAWIFVDSFVAFRSTKRVQKVNSTNPPAEKWEPTSPLGEEQSQENVTGCPAGPIVTIQDTGTSLEEKIWAYAAVWGLSQSMKRPGYVPRSLLTSLQKMYSNLSVPALPDGCLELMGKARTEREIVPLHLAAARFDQQNLLLKGNVFLTDLTPVFQDQMNVEFRIQPSIVQRVEATFTKVGCPGRITIGIYIKYSSHDTKNSTFSFPPDEISVLKEAVKWVTHGMAAKNFIFLVIGKENDEFKKWIPPDSEVAFVSKDNYHDLALVSMSDNVIFDRGAFGYWGSLMAIERGGYVATFEHKSRKTAVLYFKWRIL